MFVFSPSGKRELTISTPQISAHTVSNLSLLSSHTPVTIQQYAITTLSAVKHTHTHIQHTPSLCSPAATVVDPLSPDESLHFIQGFSWEESMCVSALCFLELSSSSIHQLPVTDNELLRHTVTQSGKSSQSV